jgi:hypothetical protein
MATAAWSWVEKMLHEAQRISAPALERLDQLRSLIVMQRPVMRALQGAAACFSRIAMRPGISVSAI